MQPEQEPSFELLYRQLEETVRRMESGELPLDEALALFEQGSQLAEQCNTLLDGAELRVRQLITGPDGGLDSAPYDGWQDNG